MSGRAGRRGIDDKGIVILMVDQKLNQTIGKQIIKVLLNQYVTDALTIFLYSFNIVNDPDLSCYIFFSLYQSPITSY